MRFKIGFSFSLINGEEIVEISFVGYFSSGVLPRIGEQICIPFEGKELHESYYTVEEVNHVIENGALVHEIILDDIDFRPADHGFEEKMDQKWIKSRLIPGFKKIGFKRVESQYDS
jgi:hypothetical protein